MNCSNCDKELEGYPRWFTTLKACDQICSPECLKEYIEKINSGQIKGKEYAPKQFKGSWRIEILGQKKC